MDLMFDESITNAFFSLGAMVALLGGVLLVMKKLVKKKKAVPGSVELKVLSRTSLQPKSHLYVVQAGKRQLLIGVSDHNINTLADLTTAKKSSSSAIPKAKAALPKISSNDLKQAENATAVNDKLVDSDLSFSSFLKSTFSKS